jgi:hypothetical protein
LNAAIAWQRLWHPLPALITDGVTVHIFRPCFADRPRGLAEPKPDDEPGPCHQRRKNHNAHRPGINTGRQRQFSPFFPGAFVFSVLIVLTRPPTHKGTLLTKESYYQTAQSLPWAVLELFSSMAWRGHQTMREGARRLTLQMKINKWGCASVVRCMPRAMSNLC